MRVVHGGAVTAALMLWLPACLDPTQITVEVTTDVPCPVAGTELTFGLPSTLESTPAAAETSSCDAARGGYIGTIVAVPSGDDDDEVAIRVVTATSAGSLAGCEPPDYGATCIVARRALRYIPHTSLRLPVPMREACRGVVCPPDQTCVQGSCRRATLDSAQCASPEGCGEGILTPPDGSAGTPGPIVQVTSQTAQSQDPFVLWKEDHLALAWSDGRAGTADNYFKRLGPDGTELQPDTSVMSPPWTDDERYPVLAPRSVGYWFAFQRGTGSNTTTVWALGDDGLVASSSHNYSGSGASALATAGTVTAIAQVTSSAVRVRAAAESAFPPAAFADITAAGAGAANPSLAAASAGFAVAWDDIRGGTRRIYVAPLDLDGVPGQGIAVTADAHASQAPSLVATDSGWGVAWQDDRHGDGEIYFAELDADGATTGAEMRTSSAAGASRAPSLVWTGAGYGLAWVDERDGNAEIYFAQLDSNATSSASCA